MLEKIKIPNNSCLCFCNTKINSFKLTLTYSFKFFLRINFSFMFVELIYGLLSNSLSLISDSAHMLFDSSALALGLYASFMSKLKPNIYFTYGYERFQILSAFTNGLFLLFVAFNIFTESL